MNNPMRHITILLAILFNAVPAMSQENVIEVMKRIPNLRETKTLHHVSSTWVADNGDDPATFCRYNELTVKKSDRRLVDDLVRAFMQDRDTGYSYFFKTAGETTYNRILTLTYGTFNQNVVRFGTRDDSNYYVIISADKTRSDKYIAYCLVWNDEGEHFRVKLYHIKGYKSRLSLYGASSQADKIKTTVEGKTVTMTSKGVDGKDYTLRYRIDDDIFMPSDSVWNGMTAPMMSIPTPKAGNGLAVNDDVDFMRLFGNLRVAFQDAVQSANTTEGRSMLIAVSTKFLEICKRYHGLLSDHEKTVCLTSLVDMAKSCEDKFISGMLHEAVMQLTPSSGSGKKK